MRRTSVLLIILLPLGVLFSQNAQGVDQGPQDPKYRWGSSFGGAFFEDKFNHLETTKAFYRLREPLIFNRPGISQDIALGFLWGEHFPDEAELIDSHNFLLYGMTRFHKDIINIPSAVQLRLSVFAGGGLGYSTTITRIEQEYGPTTEVIDYSGVGYLITTGGRFEIGPYYGETSWNIRDAEPHLLNTISIGIQSKTPWAALVAPVMYVGAYYLLSKFFSSWGL